MLNAKSLLNQVSAFLNTDKVEAAEDGIECLVGKLQRAGVPAERYPEVLKQMSFTAALEGNFELAGTRFLAGQAVGELMATPFQA